MNKFKRAEFVVGKSEIVDNVRINRGDIVQIIPIEFFDNLGTELRDLAKELNIQENLAVLVSFFTKDAYNQQFIDGTNDPKVEILVHAFSIPDMFKDLKIKARNITLKDKD